MNFREKEGGSLQSKKFVAKKRNIVFRNEGEGGGSEAVWKFSENSSKMGHRSVPKGRRPPILEFFPHNPVYSKTGAS